MDPVFVVRENWLSRKPLYNGWKPMLVLGLLLHASNIAFFNGWADWLPASANSVFADGQYWRAWTALFAHSDLGHFFSNAFLFLPLTYLLTSYYGYMFFPVAGLFCGGFINLLVIQTLPPETSLLGISGVVYWMGAAWLTLFVLIDRRSSWRKRMAVAVTLSVMLFVPETYKPEVSHLSHLIGFVFGILCAALYYRVHRGTIEAAEVREAVIEELPT